jgi:hypothetical protein
MKNFKRIGTLLISGFVLFAFLSCDNKDLPSLLDDREPVAVDGQITADHVSFFVNDRNTVNIEESFIYGHGFLNSNGSSKISTQQTHVTYFETESSVQIECGEFSFSDENGDRIFGTYCGCGDYGDGNVCVEMVMSVNGGTGRYVGANGNISAIVNRDLTVENSDHILELKGVILLAAE